MILERDKQYATFSLHGETRSGWVIAKSWKTVTVKMSLFGPEVKRHRKKHNVRIYPMGVKPK